MTSFIVHSFPGSPYGRAVIATLMEKGAAFRLAPVAANTFRKEPHISRHPFGKVPVLEHDGFMLYETQAILRYLDRVLPSPPLTPADPRAAARMDQVMNMSDWYLFNGVGNVIGFHRIVAPRVLGQAPDEAAIQAAMPKAHRIVRELDRMLGDQSYFAGESLSLADILLASHLDFFAATPEWDVLVADKPKLGAWLSRMQARPSLTASTWEQVLVLAEAA